MVVLSALMLVALFGLFAWWRDSERLGGSDWPVAAVFVTIAGVLTILGSFLSTLSDTEPDYLVTVNDDKFYCERGVFEFDASYAWPGWTLEHYSSHDEDAVCYIIPIEGS